MRLSLKLQPQYVSWHDLERVWMLAEEMPEVDAAYLFDHFYPINVEDHTGPCFEGWSALSFLAGRTERLRLGLVVTGVTYRHPAVLANMCATIDQASGGRLEIGMGAAWNEEEHTAYGIDFPPVRVRMDMLDEALGVLHALLTQEVSNLPGPHYPLTEARCEPKPVQRPRPPFLLGGQGEKRMLPIVAKWADHWNYPGTTIDGLKQKLDVLHAACVDIDRDPSEIEVSMHLFEPTDPTHAAFEARALAAGGCDHVMLYMQRTFDPAIVRAVAQSVADAIL